MKIGSIALEKLLRNMHVAFIAALYHQRCSRLLFVVLTSTTTERNLVRNRCISTCRFQSLMKESEGRDLEGGTESWAMGDSAYWLASSCSYSSTFLCFFSNILKNKYNCIGSFNTFLICTFIYSSNEVISVSGMRILMESR